MPTDISSGTRKTDLESRNAPRGKRLPKEERRRQLVNVACSVFAERGYDAASLEEIAERAGVSRPILYSHFGDKQGLFEAVVGMQIARVESVVIEALALPGEPRELVERGMRAFFTYVREHPDGHAVLTRDAPVHLSDSGLGVMLDGMTSKITQVIESQIVALESDPAPAPIYANALIGIGVHVGRWWRDHPDVPLGDVTAQTTEMIWNGFGGIIAQGPGARD